MRGLQERKVVLNFDLHISTTRLKEKKLPPDFDFNRLWFNQLTPGFK